MNHIFSRISLIFIALLISFGQSQAAIKMKPTKLQGLDYKNQLLHGDYKKGITNPKDILGFEVGKMTATPIQIIDAVTLWDEQSVNMQLVEYARSHEKRPLVYAIISSEKNLARLDSIKANLAKLANPQDLSAADADAAIEELPGVAWMAYSIHGNETSGSDSALASIYHLIASESPEVTDLLDKLVIIIDPSMNPDGRARFTKRMQESRAVAPNVDDQSILHQGQWPFGRTNHYLFDLNRDFILGVHPETRGRVKAINIWHPQLMIDGHEMGSQDTFLFAPAREPINKNLSPRMKRWGNIFANDQGDAFDSKGWPYYTGEWFENLYPGYSSYAEFRGSVHILYEQARMAEDGVRQGNERILSYQEAVHHQMISTLANLTTLAKNSKQLYQDQLADRRHVISNKSPYANISYAFVPDGNNKRWVEFIDLLQLQGFELQATTAELKFSKIVTPFGANKAMTLPKGSLIVRNRQPEARLISAMLEFDPKINDEVLVEERQRILRDGSSLMYDTTAWNLAMMHGIETYRINSELKYSLEDYEPAGQPESLTDQVDTIAYLVNGTDDASVAFAARLMEQGVQVRISNKQSEFNSKSYSRGSVLINKYDNEYFNGNLFETVRDTAADLSLVVSSVKSGMGEGDLPEVGGSHFELLDKPKIAILTRAGINPYDYGSIWHSIDSNLGIRHSHLDLSTFSFVDLRRYNTVVIPSRFYGRLGEAQIKALDTWVKAGGSLVVSNSSIPQFVDKKKGISKVRLLADSLEKADEYDLALMQEWLAEQSMYPEVAKSREFAMPSNAGHPLAASSEKADAKVLKANEKWQRQFSPSGAIVSARTDQKHWLTYGLPSVIPVLVSNVPVLMSGEGSEAPVRFGHWVKSKSDTKMKRYGWFHAPKGYELSLRMSGLLWPEASQRLANAAYLTRESKGRGQIILFAAQPVFRGSTKVSNRMLLNALVYGPGLGANPIVNPL